jgi:energy-converting hydrogenase Eha subunit A
MKKLWFYFNTVQLASTFTEFNLVKTPANVSMVKKSYDSIIHVKLIPDELMTKVKALFGIKTPIKNPEETDSEPSDSTSEPTHRKLSELSPKQIRNNRIALGVVLLLIIISFAVVIILRRRIWAKLPLTVKNLLRSLPQMFIWNGVIRSLLELFYPTTLLAMSAAAANLHNKSKLAIPLAKIGFFVGFLGVTAIHIESKKEVIDTAEYKSKYGAYFTNVETYIKPRAVHYSTIFLARRLTIALTIVCLKGSGVL